jgi:hypothetical protein
MSEEKRSKFGCLKVGLIIFFALVVAGVLINKIADNQWEKERPQVLAAITSAMEDGHYDQALHYANVQGRSDDAEIKALVAKVEGMKKQATIDGFVVKIKEAQMYGKDIEKMLGDLILLDPNNSDFATEIAAIRENERLSMAVALAAKEAERVAIEKQRIAEEAKRNEPCDLTWKEIDDIYNAESKATDIVKDEKWKAYKGLRVRWTGTVAGVDKIFGKYQVSVKMNKNSFTHDVTFHPKDDQVDEIFKLAIDDTITFEATLVQWGTLLPITAKEGVIVERK